MAVFRYEDRPGIVGTVGRILGEPSVNIAGMQVSRDRKGGHALVAMTVDSAIPHAVLDEIVSAIGAERVRVRWTSPKPELTGRTGGGSHAAAHGSRAYG